MREKMAEQRLIDANEIPYHKSGFPKGDGFDSGLDWAFREDIEKLPTVDAAPVVHGRWIPLATSWGDKATCSVCGRDLCVNEPGNGLLDIEDLHYCPNCGAKMDGGTDNG